MFEAIKKSAEALGKKFNPKILLADAAPAITNGFKSVFNLEKRIICWAHVIRNLDIYLKPVKTHERRQSLREDIARLQWCTSSVQFEKALELFFF